jgi:hypothetical protein
MKTLIQKWIPLFSLLAVFAPSVMSGPMVFVAPDAPLTELLAAKEVARYYYIINDEPSVISRDIEEWKSHDGRRIWVGSGGRLRYQPFFQSLPEAGAPVREALSQSDGYWVQTMSWNDHDLLLVIGADARGTLYGAYRFAEELGVRFFLHGDVIPEPVQPWTWGEISVSAAPLFAHRGIQPFHDFPEGPDWWDSDGYKAIMAQLPKMGMNFFGLHTYPEGGVGPEPLVWIGCPEDLGREGEVEAAYPARHFTTWNGTWGYRRTNTSDYLFGADAIYPRDDYGTDYMMGMAPWPEGDEEERALFGRVGALLKDVFGFARELGIHTCIGTETPLIIPTPVRERLEKEGRDPSDPAVVQEVYSAMFQRIMDTHPLDYYWFWTPEGWTWEGTTQEQIDRTKSDLEAALAAAAEVRAPFTLATCGWVLGPAQDRSMFDQFLPKSMPMSCINRQVGYAPVEPGFADVEGRPKWAIPWLEDDPAMISPQLWVGRMRKDAADALAYGCDGLMGIHWRTRILGPNVLSLARAAWSQEGWKPEGYNPARPVETSGPEGVRGGNIAAFPGHEIADTEQDPIYQTVRYNLKEYRFDVPEEGEYRVTLKFCEPHYDDPGKRIFSVELQGEPVIEGLDVLERVGKDRALDYAFERVRPRDGQIVVRFLPIVEFPFIAGLVIEGDGYRRALNCGGQSWEDFEADFDLPAGDGMEDRFLPAADFYLDWASALFGAEAGPEIAEVFTQLDGHLPKPSTWVNGPGGIQPDNRPWEQVATEYEFVMTLADLRSKVSGAANLERFDYWLNTFRYMKANARFNCILGQYNQVMDAVRKEPKPEEKARMARQKALPLRIELVRQAARVQQYLLSSITTTGGMGNVTNWQQHIFPVHLIDPAEELESVLGEPLPDEAKPNQEYHGKPRMFIPFVRTLLEKGEGLNLTAHFIGTRPNSVLIRWRPIGGEEFQETAFQKVARGVYEVRIAPGLIRDDFEYYVVAESPDGRQEFPAGAPARLQTVVVIPTMVSPRVTRLQ